MKTNNTLHQAKAAKKDEFYTQLVDIERELQHYEYHFKGKVVYLNCDDYQKSNFYKYFMDNFEILGLTKVICSGLFNSSYLEYDSTNGQVFKHISDNGDFRSNEMVELLKQSDIIVTNPPFSLFREYVAQLIEYDKRFLIIGNINSLTCKEIFKQIHVGKVWSGVNMGRGISGFIVPPDYELFGTEVKIDNDGNKIIATNGCIWLTNLEHSNRMTHLPLHQSYYGNEHNYPKYDNLDAINVDKTKDIPNDYFGIIGVPITFLHKFNPKQFKIVGFRKGSDNKDLKINGKSKYCRVLVKNINQN